MVGSLLQGLILLQYNHRDEITFKDLCQNIGAVNSDIIQNVHALLLPKSKLLTKAPSSKDFGPNDIIRINSNFRHNQFKIKLPTIKKKITNGPDDNPDDKAKILEERRPLIDAAIVRIMKSRKTLEHQQLIAEVTRQLSSRFQPDPAVIKIQIEQLIEREFLERDKSDMKLYRYV